MIWEIILGDVVKLLLALVVGGFIGMERELRDKSAGFRTLMFICAGATLFTIFSLRLSPTGDPGRIAAQIVTGIGFLGAGVIMRESGRVRGLTTAATIWMVAALGMGIGAGFIGFTLSSAAIILFAMWFFPFIEMRLERALESRNYSISIPPDMMEIENIEKTIKQHKLKFFHESLTRQPDRLVCVWGVTGTPQRHETFIRALMDDPKVIEFGY